MSVTDLHPVPDLRHTMSAHAPRFSFFFTCFTADNPNPASSLSDRPPLGPDSRRAQVEVRQFDPAKHFQ